MRRANSLEKTFMLGKIEDRRRRGLQKMRITISMQMSLIKLWEMVKDREAWSASVHGGTKSQIQLSDCTTAATGPLASHIIHSLTQTICHGPSMLFEPRVLGDTNSEIKVMMS